MFVRSLLFVVLSMIAVQLNAAEPTMGPVIETYGPVFPIMDRDVVLPEDFTYRVVFDMATRRGDDDAVNANLVSVARFLNMHARNGVARENMEVAVVFHGGALKGALRNDAFLSRYGFENPDLDLLQKLSAAGVEFFACGQSMGSRDFGKDELLSPVKVALSAMTMLTLLQSEGYALMP